MALLEGLRDYDAGMDTAKFPGLLRWLERSDFVWVAASTLFYVLLTGQPAQPQGQPSAFDSRAVESATRIAESVCLNPVVGISYQLPEEMKPEDAAALQEATYAGSRRAGIGPEARYFLYGHEEATKIARLCGAVSEGGQVVMIASPTSYVMSQGPNALQNLVTAVGQDLHAQSYPPSVKIVNGLKLLCSDAHTEANSTAKGKTEIRATYCAGVVNSYVVMWSLFGYSEPEWKRLVAGLESVKTFAPQPPKSPPAAELSSPTPSQEPMAEDFKERFDAFLKEWLTDRDAKKTTAFFDPGAYTAPPLIGTYCSGWYRTDMSSQRVAQFITQNLMGVLEEFPKQTRAAAIFSAWNRLPPQWVNASANDVSKDHFLVVKLDTDSLRRIFSGIFAHSDYGDFLRSQIRKNGNAYWVVFPEVMPDDDLFVIFMLWQRASGEWKITHMDVICQ